MLIPRVTEWETERRSTDSTEFFDTDEIERGLGGLGGSVFRNLEGVGNPHDRCLVHPGTRTTYVRYHM